MLAGFFIERWLAGGHLTQFLRDGYRTAHARDRDKIEFSVECAPTPKPSACTLSGREPHTKARSLDHPDAPFREKPPIGIQIQLAPNGLAFLNLRPHNSTTIPGSSLTSRYARFPAPQFLLHCIAHQLSECVGRNPAG